MGEAFIGTGEVESVLGRQCDPPTTHGQASQTAWVTVEDIISVVGIANSWDDCCLLNVSVTLQGNER